MQVQHMDQRHQNDQFPKVKQKRLKNKTWNKSWDVTFRLLMCLNTKGLFTAIVLRILSFMAFTNV